MFGFTDVDEWDWTYNPIEAYLERIDAPNDKACLEVLNKYRDRFLNTAGSLHNHQAWPGGYLDHITEVLNIADVVYDALTAKRAMTFRRSSAFLVLYLHDIEKPWKYEIGPDGEMRETDQFRGDKAAQQKFREDFLVEHGIVLTPEEENALKYVEGELSDYDNHRRVSNELAGFCHVCDTISARVWHNFPAKHCDPWLGAGRHRK